jgi:hypothetical protein
VPRLSITKVDVRRGTCGNDQPGHGCSAWVCVVVVGVCLRFRQRRTADTCQQYALDRSPLTSRAVITASSVFGVGEMDGGDMLGASYQEVLAALFGNWPACRDEPFAQDARGCGVWARSMPNAGPSRCRRVCCRETLAPHPIRFVAVWCQPFRWPSLYVASLPCQRRSSNATARALAVDPYLWWDAGRYVAADVPRGVAVVRRMTGRNGVG